LVVEEVFPPAADDVFGDVDGDDVVWAFGAESADVVEDGSGDFAVGGVEDDQWDVKWGVLTILDRASRLRGSVHARAAPEVQPAVQG
jgi:hypothetical protein